jgi:hypothetical protein
VLHTNVYYVVSGKRWTALLLVFGNGLAFSLAQLEAERRAILPGACKGIPGTKRWIVVAETQELVLSTNRYCFVCLRHENTRRNTRKCVVVCCPIVARSMSRCTLTARSRVERTEFFTRDLPDLPPTRRACMSRGRKS